MLNGLITAVRPSQWWVAHQPNVRSRTTLQARSCTHFAGEKIRR